jgi:hypothetical protein
MIILVKDEFGHDIAIDFSKTGWKAIPVDGNDSVVSLEVDGVSRPIIISIEKYDSLIRELISDGEVLDLRGIEEEPLPQ